MKWTHFQIKRPRPDKVFVSLSFSGNLSFGIRKVGYEYDYENDIDLPSDRYYLNNKMVVFDEFVEPPIWFWTYIGLEALLEKKNLKFVALRNTRKDAVVSIEDADEASLQNPLKWLSQHTNWVYRNSGKLKKEIDQGNLPTL